MSFSVYAQGTVTVTGTDLTLPPTSFTFSPGTSTPIVSLSFSVISLSPIINYIKVDRTGTATNTDVQTAKLYRDVNENNVIDGGDIQLDQTRYFGGTTTQSVQFSVLSYSPSTSENLLIVYDVASGANPSHTAGADMPIDGGYITGGNQTVITFLGITTGNQPLPVELTSFTALVQNKSVNLEWQTATEVSSYGFEIQKLKSEIRSQKSEWEKIGFVQGYGNSNSPKKYSFEDKDPQAGKLQYRLKLIDFDGAFEYSNAVEINFDAPLNFVLEQNFPNPFNPETVISYQLPVSGFVVLKVYDLLGREVATLVNKEEEAGIHHSTFSLANSGTSHSTLASGIYIYRIEASAAAGQSARFVELKKMILLK
ncbi:MAG: T9SS type A sorting domain-containing protein [Ignavibacteriaceae bacterium]|nr:T9SS type A sorting domain-containing protein [Ignavibacteriaceae bacterium]